MPVIALSGAIRMSLRACAKFTIEACSTTLECINVKNFIKHAAMAAALATAFASGSTLSARAGATDYEFQLVSKEPKVGAAEIAVRLVHKPDSKAVPDAVIFATRLDMSPDGMEDMATALTPLVGGEPGLYRFKARLPMAGGWALSLGAKVQGEPETVQGKLILKAQ